MTDLNSQIAKLKKHISEAVFLIKTSIAYGQTERKTLEESVKSIEKTINDFSVELGEDFCIKHLSEMHRDWNDYLKMDEPKLEHVLDPQYIDFLKNKKKG
jgi:aconitase B